MGMHEFHVTTYVLTCDECGTTFGDGTEQYAGDLIQQAKNNGWQVISESPTDSYYCPKHWQFSCRDCGKDFYRPDPRTKEGKQWDDTHANVCPDCAKKRNLAEFEKLAKELEE